MVTPAKHKLKTAITLYLLLWCVTSAAMDTSEGIFNPRFRTLKIQNPDDFMGVPVIRLRTDDRLVVSFDEIGDDNSDLRYRLIHCDAQWKPSGIVESEYIDGFNITDIDDWGYSSNTYIHYVNYRIEISDENTRILKSGNYILEVSPLDDPDTTILRARFQVSENILPVTGLVTTRTDRGANNEWQQVSLEIDTEGIDVGNPYTDVIVTIDQNGRYDTMRTLQSPLRTAPGRIFYDHTPGLIYRAGNEYRRFETVSTQFATMGVDSVRYVEPMYHVWLRPDEARKDRPYEFDRTQHGRYMVREYNSTDSDLGADYVTVHFELDANSGPGRDIYVAGEMTHGHYDSGNRMTYDQSSGTYRLQMPLKQGAYNYQYVTRQSDGTYTPTDVEGDRYETENEYRVSVFLRPPGARYDRLVGTSLITSK